MRSLLVQNLKKGFVDTLLHQMSNYADSGWIYGFVDILDGNIQPGERR